MTSYKQKKYYFWDDWLDNILKWRWHESIEEIFKEFQFLNIGCWKSWQDQRWGEFGKIDLCLFMFLFVFYFNFLKNLQSYLNDKN